MLVATVALLATLLLAGPERARFRRDRAPMAVEHGKPVPRLLGGIGLVLRDRYLLLIALLVVLLNWINTTGEFILADFVQRDAARARRRERRHAGCGRADHGLLRQLPVLGHAGRPRHPAVPGLAHLSRTSASAARCSSTRSIVALGYGMLALSPLLGGFVPIFTLIRLVKIAENSIDYSLMNTTRHALFLPVDRDAKYEGKTAIDTFFWRFGDLVQAGAVFVGLQLAAVGGAAVRPAEPACSRWSGSGWRSPSAAVRPQGAGERDQRGARGGRADPRPALRAGAAVPAPVAGDAFRDADPGDVLHLRACCEDGRPLPAGCSSTRGSRRFIGHRSGGIRGTAHRGDRERRRWHGGAQLFVMRAVVPRG